MSDQGGFEPNVTVSRRDILGALGVLGLVNTAGIARGDEDHDHFSERWEWSSSTWGLAIRNDSHSDKAYGLLARTRSRQGRALGGYAVADTGPTWGVVGRVDSTNGTGIYGVATAEEGVSYGVFGKVASSDSYGLYTPDNARIEETISASEINTDTLRPDTAETTLIHDLDGANNAELQNLRSISTGVWNGEGREGIVIVDTTNNNVYHYRGGTWI